MVLPPRDFESRASTNSAIPAGTPANYPALSKLAARFDPLSKPSHWSPLL
jgi:hypothetical protein